MRALPFTSTGISPFGQVFLVEDKASAHPQHPRLTELRSRKGLHGCLCTHFTLQKGVGHRQVRSTKMVSGTWTAGRPELSPIWWGLCRAGLCIWCLQSGHLGPSRKHSQSLPACHPHNIHCPGSTEADFFKSLYLYLEQANLSGSFQNAYPILTLRLPTSWFPC